MLEAKYRLYMNNYITLLVIFVMGGETLFGYYLNYYVTSQVFDKILHSIGAYAGALFIYILVMQFFQGSMSKGLKAIFIFTIGVSGGALYEIFEFLSDRFMHSNPPNQPSLLDTNLDLIYDSFGALVAAIHATITGEFD
jgi:hypothetical protein